MAGNAERYIVRAHQEPGRAWRRCPALRVHRAFLEELRDALRGHFPSPGDVAAVQADVAQPPGNLPRLGRGFPLRPVGSRDRLACPAGQAVEAVAHLRRDHHIERSRLGAGVQLDVVADHHLGVAERM